MNQIGQRTVTQLALFVETSCIGYQVSDSHCFSIQTFISGRVEDSKKVALRAGYQIIVVHTTSVPFALKHIATYIQHQLITSGTTNWWQRTCHVLSCLCDDACHRSPAVCLESMPLRPSSRLPPVPLWHNSIKQGSWAKSTLAVIILMIKYQTNIKQLV